MVHAGTIVGIDRVKREIIIRLLEDVELSTFTLFYVTDGNPCGPTPLGVGRVICSRQ